MKTEALNELTSRTLGVARQVAPAVVKPDFSPTAALGDAGMTSLDLVNLMLAVETEFDIMIPPALLKPENFRTINAIVRMVEAVRGNVPA